MRGAAPGR